MTALEPKTRRQNARSEDSTNLMITLCSSQQMGTKIWRKPARREQVALTVTTRRVLGRKEV